MTTTTNPVVLDRDRLLGLITAVITGHTYTITDYHGLRVIAADEIPHIIDTIRDRMDAPAYHATANSTSTVGITAASLARTEQAGARPAPAPDRTH